MQRKFSWNKFHVVTVLLAALCSATSVFAEQKTFTLNPAQTRVDFTLGDVLHTVHGSFRLKRGAITLNDANGEASGELVVDATSGDTGNRSRDKKMHREILESDKFPEIVFTPQHFKGALNAEGKASFVIDGLFTIHGQSHPITLTVDADMNQTGASATTSFSVPYVKWGMKNPSTFILRVSDEVAISIHTVAQMAGAASGQN